MSHLTCIAAPFFECLLYRFVAGEVSGVSFCQSVASGLYITSTLAKHAAEEAGFDDALMLDYRGQVAEATLANIFLVIDNELHTPIPDCFLNGITRQTVIELAEKAGITVHERAIMPDEFASATEVFVTGTAAEITAVREIDNYKFDSRDITDLVSKLFIKLVGQ